MFTSSINEFGDLCGSVRRCVVGWRFGQEEVELQTAKEIFHFVLINVCDLGFKSDVIVYGKVFFGFY